MFRDGGILDLPVEDYLQIRRNASLDQHLDQREKDLLRDFQIALHRYNNDTTEISKQINSVAVMVGQLCSIEQKDALTPFTKLLTDPTREEIFKCNLFGEKFEKIPVPGFSFKDHQSVQIGQDIYATSHDKCEVTLIQNLLDQSKEAEIKTLTSLNKQRIDH